MFAWKYPSIFRIKSMFDHFPSHDLRPIPTFSANAGSSLPFMFIWLSCRRPEFESRHRPAINVHLFINSKCFCSPTLTIVYLPQSVPDLNYHVLAMSRYCRKRENININIGIGSEQKSLWTSFYRIVMAFLSSDSVEISDCEPVKERRFTPFLHLQSRCPWARQ